MQAPYTFFFAFVVVLALIGLAAWLVRRFGGNRLGANANRGRMPRLAVIDAAAVDGRRRLVLVRRDNVEHLLMIGGPTDIVVEQNIVRAIPGRDQAPSRSSLGNDTPRIPPASDSANWADSDATDHAELHLPEPPPRPARPSFVEEPRRPMPSLPDRRQDTPPGFMPEALTRPEPRLDTRSEPLPPRAMPRSESPVPRSEAQMPRSEPMMPRPTRPEPFRPPVRAPERATPVVPPAAAAPPVVPPPAPPAAAPVSSADQNLADMAQRLEAALRRPANSEAPEPRIGAPPVAPEPPSRPARASEISVTPPARSEPSLAPPVTPPAAKTGFENLEDEMASLLGRPKNLS
jgi:flagellar protein FliO/FliZ